MKRILLITFIYAGFGLPQSLPAQLQWQKIGSFPNRIQAVYFTDELHGFVSIGTVPGNVTLTPKLFLTVDGGVNWSVAHVSQLNSGYGIQDIMMTDSLNGWACGGCGAGYSLWRTNDGGINWNTIGSPDGRYSVAIRKSAAGIVVSDFYNQHIRISKDGGSTFNDGFKPPNNDVLLGMDFVDSLHGVLIGSFRAGNPWYYTSDGGVTWRGTTVNMESWSVHGEKGSSNFYAAPEGWSDQAYTPSSCYRSTDFGKTWNITTVFPVGMIGDVTGVGSTLYTQSQYPPGSSAGVYRSVDSGMTWAWLGGPHTPGDSRFIALPSSCRRNVIFAGSSDFNLYKAYDTSGAISSSQTSSNIITPTQPLALIKSGDTAEVQLNVKFPAGSAAIGFIPTEAEYFLGFDSKAVDVAGFSDIIVPKGWIRKSVNISNNSADITITDTSAIPLMQIENFGVVAFIGLNNPVHSGTTIELAKLILRNDCSTFSGSANSEGNFLRSIRIQSNAVASEKKSSMELRLFPNPVKKLLKISSDFIRDHNTMIMVIDETGRTLLQKNIEIQSSGEYILSVESLAMGSYEILLENGDEIARARFQVLGN